MDEERTGFVYLDAAGVPGWQPTDPNGMTADEAFEARFGKASREEREAMSNTNDAPRAEGLPPGPFTPLAEGDRWLRLLDGEGKTFAVIMCHQDNASAVAALLVNAERMARAAGEILTLLERASLETDGVVREYAAWEDAVEALRAAVEGK